MNSIVETKLTISPIFSLFSIIAFQLCTEYFLSPISKKSLLLELDSTKYQRRSSFILLTRSHPSFDYSYFTIEELVFIWYYSPIHSSFLCFLTLLSQFLIGTAALLISPLSFLIHFYSSYINKQSFRTANSDFVWRPHYQNFSKIPLPKVLSCLVLLFYWHL